MCLTLPWRVASVDGDRLVVESGGMRQPAMCLDIPDLRVGDFVVVTGSIAVRRLSAEQAAAVERALRPRPGS